MIIAVDTETYTKDLEPILDATQFTLGCIIKQGMKNPEYYTNKQHMWERLKELGRKETKRGKVLNIYAHNHEYDFYAYADLTDKGIIIHSTRPFIATYKENNKETIKFLDTLAIYKMSLKKAGQIINLPKLKMPKKAKKIDDLKPYITRDTEIVLKLILHLKKKLKKNNITTRRIYTIGQIAINHFINHMRKQPNTQEYFFWNTKKGETRRTFHAQKIHQAYRGGRNQTFNIGEFTNVNHIDFNSLYPYSATQIDFPNLKTERLNHEPKNYIKPLSIRRCLIHNQNNKYGFLPIRTLTGSHYPTKGQYLIGTWTGEELIQAINNGYKILQSNWEITWEKWTENPLKNYMENLYEKRKESKTPEDNYLYKCLMNYSIGKLAQTRTGQEITIDSIEKTNEYLQNNAKIINDIGYLNIYKKDIPTQTKPYYTPIIPTLTNAKARVIMNTNYTKIPQKDILYTDTDSIFYQGNHTNKFNTGDQIGQFSIEHENTNMIIYGRKTYSIGNDIHVSGFKTKNITIKQFQEGIIENKRIQGIRSTTNLNQIGTFKTQKRNLNNQLDESIQRLHLLQNNKIFIDANIEDITPFHQTLKNIM